MEKNGIQLEHHYRLKEEEPDNIDNTYRNNFFFFFFSRGDLQFLVDIRNTASVGMSTTTKIRVSFLVKFFRDCIASIYNTTHQTFIVVSEQIGSKCKNLKTNKLYEE